MHSSQTVIEHKWQMINSSFQLETTIYISDWDPSVMLFKPHAFKENNSPNTAECQHSTVSALLLTGNESSLSHPISCSALVFLKVQVERERERGGSPTTTMHRLPLKRFIHVCTTLSVGHQVRRPASLFPGPSVPKSPDLWEAVKTIRAREKGGECFLEKANKLKRSNPATVLSESSWRKDKAPSGLSVHWISW